MKPLCSSGFLMYVCLSGCLSGGYPFFVRPSIRPSGRPSVHLDVCICPSGCMCARPCGCMCACACGCMCLSVWMYVCLSVWMYVSIRQFVRVDDICLSGCMYACPCVSMSVCPSGCMLVRVDVCVLVRVDVCVCLDVCVLVRLNVCVSMSVYPSGFLMYVSVCQCICFSVCLSVCFCVSLSAWQKYFAEPQTLMLPTLLNSPGIRKHFNSPLHFKLSAIEIITIFELKPLIAYQNLPTDRPADPTRPPDRSPALLRARPPAHPHYHSSALRSPRRIVHVPARPPAGQTVNQRKQYLLDWPPALRLHA